MVLFIGTVLNCKLQSTRKLVHDFAGELRFHALESFELLFREGMLKAHLFLISFAIEGLSFKVFHEMRRMINQWGLIKLRDMKPLGLKKFRVTDEL